MIIGIGTDIIEISRFIKLSEKKKIMDKLYTPLEQKLFNGRNYNSLAVNFAAKEAVSKAFGTGFRSIFPADIEVLRDCLGKPYIVLHNKAKEKAKEMNVKNIYVSLSHSKDIASAYVILEG